MQFKYNPLLPIQLDIVGGGGGSSGSGNPKMIKLIATGKSAGNLNLTDTSWAVSKAQIMRILVTSSCLDFDVAIYEKDTFLLANQIYKIANNSLMLDTLIGFLVYEDQDASSELHMQIINNAGGSPTFDIEIRGIQLS